MLVLLQACSSSYLWISSLCTLLYAVGIAFVCAHMLHGNAHIPAAYRLPIFLEINGSASAEEGAMTATGQAEDVATGKKGAKSKADKKLARSADHHLEGKDAKVDRPMCPDRETVSRQNSSLYCHILH